MCETVFAWEAVMHKYFLDFSIWDLVAQTHLRMCEYSRLQLSFLAACLFGTATQYCFQTQTSMPMCICGNTVSHHVFRANEPWWLGLTVLWVWSWIAAHTKGVRYLLKNDLSIFWDFVDNNNLTIFCGVFLHWYFGWFRPDVDSWLPKIVIFFTFFAVRS